MNSIFNAAHGDLEYLHGKVAAVTYLNRHPDEPARGDIAMTYQAAIETMERLYPEKTTGDLEDMLDFAVAVYGANRGR